METATTFLKAFYAHPLSQDVLTALQPSKLTDFAAVASHPTTAVAAGTILLMTACWLGQVTTGYWSWVDRAWSIQPLVVAAVYAASGSLDKRVLLITSLIFTWAARLTRNFVRKGGYGDEEDYRWHIIRSFFARLDPLHPLCMQLFSLGFVAVFQVGLISAFAALPLHAAWMVRGTQAAELNWKDAVVTAVWLLAFAGEHWTDEVQWAFQTAKAAMTPAQRTKAGGDYARGFCTSGPFRYSRHLNFFCENVMWWSIAAFSWAAGQALSPAANPAYAGAFILTCLFQGSTHMTEDVSAGKYPEYAAYKQTTSRLMPWLPGLSLDSAEGAALCKAARASPYVSVWTGATAGKNKRA